MSELVLGNSVCGYVFDQYEIDYCTAGHQTLLAACGERRLDPARVIGACESAIRRRQIRACDHDASPARHLLLTVVAHHHRYLYETLPLLVQLTEKVTRQSSERHPALLEIVQTVRVLAKSMMEHLDDEERDMFPRLFWGKESEVRDKLSAVHGSHDRIMNLLECLRHECTDYVPPRWSGNRIRMLYAELAYLDADTRRHLHFENDVLIPRFLAESQAHAVTGRISG